VSRKKFEELITDNLKNIDVDTSDEGEEGNEVHRPVIKRMKSAKLIPTEKIRPDPNQPRRNFNETSLEELARSIQEYGVRQPIVVEQDKEKDTFRIVSGERRYRASKSIGLSEMPCIVQEKAEPGLRFAQQLIENIHSEDFSPIDKARAMLEYKELLGKEVPWSDVEKRIGISESRRKQFVSLLNLPEEIQTKIVSTGKRPSKNQITEKHARALLMLKGKPEKQLELFQMIQNPKTPLTGDQAIELAKRMQGRSTMRVFKVKYQNRKELIEKLEEALVDLRKKIKETSGVPR